MNRWNRFPLFRLLIPFVLGIVVAVNIQAEYFHLTKIILFLFVVSVIMALTKTIYIKYRFRWLFGAVAFLLFFLVGYQLTIYKTAAFHPYHFSENIVEGELNLAVGNVKEQPVEKENSIKMVVEIISTNNKEAWYNTGGETILYLQKDSASKQISYGDQILMNARLNQVKPPANPGQFNYRQYLSTQGIYHQAYIRSGQWKILENELGNPIFTTAYLLRDKLLKVYRENGLVGEEFAVASALILGYRDEINTDLKTSYSKAGAMHVLAVSGLHVGIIFLVFDSLLLFLKRFKNGNIIKAGLLILLLWSYALLTGLSPSVMRAATMFSFVVVGKAFNQYTNVYNTLVVSLFLLLIINPYLITSVGFQFSYLAVFGIVYLYPKLYYQWEPANWLVDKAWAIICVSIAAQLATFPLGLLYFHQFPNYFLLSNLFVIPLATMVIYLGLLVFITSPFTWLSLIITKLLSGTIMILNAAVRLVERAPYSSTTDVSINLAETILIYGLVVLLISFFILNSAKHLKWGMAIATVLMLFQIVENHYQLSQKKFIVYDVPKHSAYDLVKGKNALLIADSELLIDPKMKQFNMSGNWLHLGVNQCLEMDLNNWDITKANAGVFMKRPFLQHGNARIVLIDKDFSSHELGTEKIDVDYIVVSDHPKLKIADLIRIFNTSKIIFDSSIPKWKVMKWVNQCKNLNVNYHVVSQSGAFVAAV